MKPLSVLLILVVVGCGEPSESSSLHDQAVPRSARPESALKNDLTLTLIAAQLPDRSVRLSGTTNLPAGTQLILAVKEDVDDGYNALSETYISGDGTFGPETLGPDDGFADGRYVAEVTMPMAVFQPPAVKQIIGKRGEYLTGPLVKDGTQAITVIKKFVINGDIAAPEPRNL